MSNTGFFLSFEGIDGAGKSSHLDALAAALRQAGHTVTLTREPGGTPLAEQLRHLLLHHAMDAHTEALLAFAARRNHVCQVIAPALARGEVVISDRFSDATFAYQGAGRGLDWDVLLQLERLTLTGFGLNPDLVLKPDLTLWFDLPAAVAAQRLASEGAHVVIADMDEKAGEAAAAQVGGTFVKVNVTSPEDNERMYKVAVDTYGSIDVAFHNAGISPPDDDSILDTGLEAWKRVQDVNLTSVYLGCKAVLPYMLEQGRGSIINVASFVATMGAATSQISYTASKGGVLSMSRELGVQFARQGVRVNAISPGPVKTPLLMELFAKDPERAARRYVHIPFGRFGEPEEIAAAVAFLASDDSSFITASNFLVDGGISGAYVTPL